MRAISRALHSQLISLVGCGICAVRQAASRVLRAGGSDRDALAKTGNSVLLLTEIAGRNAIVFPSAIPASVLGQQQHRYYWERSVSGIVYTQKQFLYRPK